MGVMDGHGLKGHIVTEYLAQQLPARIQEYLMAEYSSALEGESAVTEMPFTVSSISDALSNSFRQAHEDALLNPNVPAGRSGTTCIVSVVIVSDDDDSSNDDDETPS